LDVLVVRFLLLIKLGIAYGVGPGILKGNAKNAKNAVPACAETTFSGTTDD
jgi:hypothetical protein